MRRPARDGRGPEPSGGGQLSVAARARRGDRPPRLRHGPALAERGPLRPRDRRASSASRRPSSSACALAGVLHDVGKIGVRDAILQKPGPLDERRVGGDAQAPGAGRAHPRRGGPRRHRRVGLRAPRAPRRRAATRSACAATQIPLEARILAVADAYEAMTSARPYSPRPGARGGRGRAAPLRGHAVRPAVSWRRCSRPCRGREGSRPRGAKPFTSPLVGDAASPDLPGTFPRCPTWATRSGSRAGSATT